MLNIQQTWTGPGPFNPLAYTCQMKFHILDTELNNVGAGAMAQSVKCLPTEQIPRKHVKNQIW